MFDLVEKLYRGFCKSNRKGDLGVMKKLLFIFIFLITAFGATAQEQMFRYQGEVNLGYSFGMEDDSQNLNLEFVNGIRFSRSFFAGVGGGFSGCLGDEALVIPLYLQVKGYFPMTEKLDLLAGCDVGTKLDYFYETSGGLLFRPEFGITVRLNRKTALSFALRYEMYSL